MTDTVFDPDVKSSEQALARTKKFREIKNKIGLEQLQFDSLFKQTKVYFDNTGEITCITQDKNFEPDPDWLTYDFTPEELDMVSENVSGSRFSVYNVDGIYEIVQSTNKMPVGITQGPDLVKVEETADADVVLRVKDTEIIVSATPELQKIIKDNGMKIENVRVLSFFVTQKNNPHFMIYNFYVPLMDLANQESVKIPCDDDFTDYSIYTKPVIDSYGRV